MPRRLRRAGTIAGALLAAGVSSLVAAVPAAAARSTLVPAGVVLICLAALVRFRDLRRGNLARVPRSFTAIALSLPARTARPYLNELGSTVDRAEPADRRRLIANVLREAPSALAIRWGGWLRGLVVSLTIRALRGRVARIEAVLGDGGSPALPRRVRRYCRLIRWATGTWQYPLLSEAADALSRACAGDAARADARQAARALLTAMTRWDPAQA